MKLPDLDRARSEKMVPFSVFLASYNQGLPLQFPRASAALLREFRKTHTALFKSNLWSLDQHRKKVMDWLTTKQAEQRMHS